MPELCLPKPELANLVTRMSHDCVDSREIGDLLEKMQNSQDPLFEEANVVGFGSECVVTHIDKQPQKVAAISYQEMTPHEAKSVFYLQRIYSTLFPHNFPHFYAAFGNQEDAAPKLTGTIRKIVPEDYTVEVKYPFSFVTSECLKWGIPLKIDRRWRHDNLLVGADGGEYYIDKPTEFGKYFNPEVWNVNRIAQYMEHRKMDPVSVKTVMLSLKRLTELKAIRTDDESLLIFILKKILLK